MPNPLKLINYAFSILDSTNSLWLVKGDSPLHLIHIPKYGIYIYASTEEILYRALIGTPFFDELKKGGSEISGIFPRYGGRAFGRGIYA